MYTPRCLKHFQNAPERQRTQFMLEQRCKTSIQGVASTLIHAAIRLASLRLKARRATNICKLNLAVANLAEIDIAAVSLRPFNHLVLTARCVVYFKLLRFCIVVEFNDQNLVIAEMTAAVAIGDFMLQLLVVCLLK